MARLLPAFLSLVALLPAVAAPLPRTTGKDAYLPLTEGAKRELECFLGDTSLQKSTETVVGVESKGGERTVTVHTESAASGRVNTPTVYTLTADGVHTKREGTADAVVIFQSGLKAGDSWKEEGTESGRKVVWVTYTVGNEEEIEVPAGKFTAVSVTREHLSGRKEIAWYARGIGLVKWEGTIRGAASSTVLTAFTTGKDAKK